MNAAREAELSRMSNRTTMVPVYNGNEYVGHRSVPYRGLQPAIGLPNWTTLASNISKIDLRRASDVSLKQWAEAA